MTRLFLAVWPSATATEHVRSMCSLLAPAWRGVRWTPEENWHVTLRFLDEADITQVTQALTGRQWPSATARLSSTFQPLSTHSVVMPVSGVDQLAYAVADAVGAPLGMFHGHLTVGRRARRDQPMHGPASPAKAPPPCEFDVDSFALVASTLTSSGPIYDTVAEFATSPGGAR